MEFVEFPKMARLSRDVIVTEKIDGTNAQVYIAPMDDYLKATEAVATNGDLFMFAGSRSRYITPDADNFGFARWVKEHADELWTLGSGRHFGEWWGSGIQRGYGLEKGDKRFSLFNVGRWALHGTEPRIIPSGDPRVLKYQDVLPACVGLVPVIYRGTFDSFMGHVDDILENLARYGSQAAPGFMKPEGIVAFHVAGNIGFKKTIEKDDEPKSKYAHAVAEAR